MKVFRRYSDFEALWNNLRKHYPFHYISPVHVKEQFPINNLEMINEWL